MKFSAAHIRGGESADGQVSRNSSTPQTLDVEVLCHCRMKASRRISHTEANPGRKFFGCPRYVSKVDPGCGFFVWYDIGIAAAAEKQQLVRLVEFLQTRVLELEHQNDDLRKRVAELSEVGSSDTKVETQLDMLTSRVSQLEMSSGLRRFNSVGKN
ncbi:hypothetical protein LINPERHAP2_LOCUS25648 [Linum perenne]